MAETYSLAVILCIAIPLGVVALFSIIILLILGFRFSCVAERIYRARRAERMAMVGDYRRASASSLAVNGHRPQQKQGEMDHADEMDHVEERYQSNRRSEDQAKVRSTMIREATSDAGRNNSLNQQNDPHVSNSRTPSAILNVKPTTGVPSSQQSQTARSIHDLSRNALPLTSGSPRDHSSTRFSNETPPVLSSLELSGFDGHQDFPMFHSSSILSYPVAPSLKSFRSSVAQSTSQDRWFDGKEPVRSPYYPEPEGPIFKNPQTPLSQITFQDFQTARGTFPAPPAPSFQSPSRNNTFLSKDLLSSADFDLSALKREISSRFGSTLPLLDIKNGEELSELYNSEQEHKEGQQVLQPPLEFPSEKTEIPLPAKSALRPKVTPKTSFGKISLKSQMSSIAESSAMNFLKESDLKECILEVQGSLENEGLDSNIAPETLSPTKPKGGATGKGGVNGDLMVRIPKLPYAQKGSGKSPESEQSSMSRFQGQVPNLTDSPSKQFAPSSNIYQQSSKLGLIWTSPAASAKTEVGSSSVASSTKHDDSQAPAIDSQQQDNDAEPLDKDDPVKLSTSSQSIQSSIRRKMPANEFYHFPHEILKHGSSPNTFHENASQSEEHSVLGSPFRESQSQDSPETTENFRKQLFTRIPKEDKIKDSNQRFRRTEVIRGHSTVSSFAGSVVTRRADERTTPSSGSLHRRHRSTVSLESFRSATEGRANPREKTETPVMRPFPERKLSSFSQSSRKPSKILLPSALPRTQRPDPLKISRSIRDIATFNVPSTPQSPGYQPGLNMLPESNDTGRPNTKQKLDANTKVAGTAKKESLVIGSRSKGSGRTAGAVVISPRRDSRYFRTNLRDSDDSKRSRIQQRLNKPLPSIPFSIKEGVSSSFGGSKFLVEHPYSSKLVDELDLEEGDVVKVFELFDDGWCLARIVKSERNLAGLTTSGVCPQACLSKTEWRSNQNED